MTSTKPADRFQSRTDAIKAARVAIWGDLPLARRAFITPNNRPDVSFYDDRRLPVLAVTAQVNLDLVVIEFDHYGRHTSVTVLPR